jgi:hypothetical protein
MHCDPLKDHPVHESPTQPVTLQQAALESPTLARLAALARDSSERLKAVELINPCLRPAIRPVPSTGLNGACW